MTITGTCGNRSVGTEEELLHVLKTSRSGDLAEFWLADERFPVLVIHLNHGLAYLHYFPADGHPGFQPRGNPEAKGQVKFSNEILVPRAVVVEVEQAYRAAVEFFGSRNLPSCIEWFEL